MEILPGEVKAWNEVTSNLTGGIPPAWKVERIILSKSVKHERLLIPESDDQSVPSETWLALHLTVIQYESEAYIHSGRPFMHLAMKAILTANIVFTCNKHG